MFFFKVEMSSFDDEAKTVFIIHNHLALSLLFLFLFHEPKLCSPFSYSNYSAQFH